MVSQNLSTPSYVRECSCATRKRKRALSHFSSTFVATWSSISRLPLDPRCHHHYQDYLQRQWHLKYIAGFDCCIAQYLDILYEDISSVKSISCTIYHTDYNISRNLDHFHVHSSIELCCHSIENQRLHTSRESSDSLPSFYSCSKCTHGMGYYLSSAFYLRWRYAHVQLV